MKLWKIRLSVENDILLEVQKHGEKRRSDHESGETSIFIKKRQKEKPEITSQEKPRTPVSYLGDVFIRHLGLERREIKTAISNTQMTIYLMWRNMYWTRFYGAAANGNSPVSVLRCDAVGVVSPVKRLVSYLENMFLRVEPFLSRTPPGRESIVKTILSMTRGPNRILQIHPVVHSFGGEDLEEGATDLFDSNLGVSFIDENLCRNMTRVLSGDSMRLVHICKGIMLLHRKWLLAELGDALG